MLDMGSEVERAYLGDDFCDYLQASKGLPGQESLEPATIWGAPATSGPLRYKTNDTAPASQRLVVYSEERLWLSQSNSHWTGSGH